MKTPNTDAAIKKWLSEAKVAAPAEERIAAFLKERTHTAFKAKDMSLLPTRTELREAVHCGGRSIRADALSLLGAAPIDYRGRARWALVEEK